MKNVMKYAAVVAVVCMALLFAGCEGTPKSFDKGLLTGTWVVEGNEADHWRFEADGTGASWYEADDVTEDEAQPYLEPYGEPFCDYA